MCEVTITGRFSFKRVPSEKKQYVDSTYQVHAQRTFCSSSYHQQLQLEHAGLSLALPNNMDLFFLVCSCFFWKRNMGVS